ncbi:hypothetical protein L7F22_019142 [Adiantum nelumboides]|nr:hypothetical protein [Adiantum nelumboides]
MKAIVISTNVRNSKDGKKEGEKVVEKNIPKTVRYELPSSPLHSKASLPSSLSKTPERFILESSTPSFLRSDPYIICNPVVSLSGSNPGSPEIAYYQEEESLSPISLASNHDSKTHSPSSSTSTGTGKKRTRIQLAPGRIVELARAESVEPDRNSRQGEEIRFSHRHSRMNSFNNSNPRSSSLSDLSIIIDGVAY